MSLDKLRKKVAADLAAADSAFEHSCDPILALEMIQLAADVGLPLPPNVAAWIGLRLTEYLSGQAESLDRALGLVPKPGAASARNRRLDRGRWNSLLSEVHLLSVLGATIPQAAHMVAITRNAKASTLERKYRESSREAERERDGNAISRGPRPFHRVEIMELLEKYPNDEESRLAKLRIMKRFPPLGMHAT